MSEVIEHTPNLWRVYDFFSGYNQPQLTEEEEREAGREHVLYVRHERNEAAQTARRILKQARSLGGDRPQARAFGRAVVRSMLEHKVVPGRATLPALRAEQQRLLSWVRAYERPDESEQRRRNAMWCGEQDGLEMTYQGMRAQLVIINSAIAWIEGGERIE